MWAEQFYTAVCCDLVHLSPLFYTLNNKVIKCAGPHFYDIKLGALQIPFRFVVGVLRRLCNYTCHNYKVKSYKTPPCACIL